MSKTSPNEKAFAVKAPAKKPIHIHFTANAWNKQLALLNEYNTEIGWHGLTRPIQDGWEVYDITVYPQTVTAATVEVDQEEYGRWYFEHPHFDDLHYHGHSHVYMDTHPSGTDIQSQEERHIPDNQFYIFMIWNKDLYYTARIYDHGTIREQDEVLLTYDTFDPSFLDEVKTMVKVESLPLVQPPIYFNQYNCYKQYDWYTYGQEVPDEFK